MHQDEFDAVRGFLGGRDVTIFILHHEPPDVNPPLVSAGDDMDALYGEISAAICIYF